MPWKDWRDFARRRGASYQALPEEAQKAGFHVAQNAINSGKDEGYAIATGWSRAREKATALKKGK